MNSETSITGWTMHELGNSLAPMQLWIVTQVSDEPAYTVQNVNSRTFMDIPDSMSISCLLGPTWLDL